MHFKTYAFLAIFVTILVTVVTAAQISVAIENFSFKSQTVKIRINDSVQWTNKDRAGHTATSDTGVWDSGMLATGASFSRTFTQRGSFPYHCAPHPGMKGTVIVE
ncbi:hypothetical protein BGW38_009134 [Lunasporangiospora selenospora]|uniref:Blue (type 1) copper domain-containing protein n=1 Tax=Lunasporangiospora selenospora TaxID=979761 RepID=A0A9P6FXS5_9FUNG|nr:hypothetical protein BGW38_009134 [Lunasporangiospora selenospora]